MARPVQLGQDVIGEIADEVQPQHLLGDAGELGPLRRAGCHRDTRAGTYHHRLGVVPVGDQRQVGILGTGRRPAPCPVWPPWTPGSGSPCSRGESRPSGPGQIARPGPEGGGPGPSRRRAGRARGGPRPAATAVRAKHAGCIRRTVRRPRPRTGTRSPAERASATDQVHGNLRHVAEGFVPDVWQRRDQTRAPSPSVSNSGVWSVPRWAATAAASADSSNARSENPTVNVRTGRALCCCISATTTLESIPPGQEGADRHVGHHAGGHGIGQRRLELVGQYLGRSRQGIADGPTRPPFGPTRRLRDEGGSPGRLVALEGHHLAGQELGGTPVDGVRCRECSCAGGTGLPRHDPGRRRIGAACVRPSARRRTPSTRRPSRSTEASRRSGRGPGAVRSAVGPIAPGRTSLRRHRVPRSSPHALDRPYQHLGVRSPSEGQAFLGQPLA